MCKLKSMIVLKDRIYCPDHDHHQKMLEELGIEDNYLGASKTFVRVELSPANDDVTIPVNEWQINVDQDITPEWFDVSEYRERIYETVKAWAVEHIHTSGVVKISAGILWAWGSATVEACDSATVKAYGSATVEAWGSATVKACGSATVFDSIYWVLRVTPVLADNATYKCNHTKTIYQAGDGWTLVKAVEEVTPKE